MFYFSPFNYKKKKKASVNRSLFNVNYLILFYATNRYITVATRPIPKSNRL